MKIAILGCGAMGSVYAGLLASAGHEIWAVDTWREHVDAMRAKGLHLEGASGDRTVKVNATLTASDAGVCDLVIIATKARDVETAARAARPSAFAAGGIAPLIASISERRLAIRSSSIDGRAFGIFAPKSRT